MASTTQSAPQQQVSMPAFDLRQFIGSLIRSEGVCGLNDLKVSQRGAGANMSVDVAAGACYIQDDHGGSSGGFYHSVKTAVTNVSITAADPTNPRLDRIVMRVRDAYLGDADNTISIITVNGTPTSGATLLNLNGAAAVPSNCLLLANVLVAASDTSITDSEIDTTISPGVRQHVALVGQRSPIWHSEATGNVANFDTGAVSGVTIPGTFRDLELVWVLRGDQAVTFQDATMRFNNDSGSNYDREKLDGTGATASADESNGGTAIGAICYVGSSGSASRVATGRAQIADYAKTTFFKSVLMQAGLTHGTGANSNISRVNHGLWRSTAAITRIQIIPNSGNFIAGSRLTVFGIV